MSYTNSTPNYDLPQWIGTDKPTFLGDFNSAFSAIDTAMKNNQDAASAATSTANAASATATSANTNANTALSTANNAKDTADAASSAASSATSTANTAKTTADAAARTAQANNIANLAPAYDPALTYAVGDLVPYIDDNNTGKFYKCIVAVNTPMAFNVNYWDDVTASEIFAGKEVAFFSHTVTSGETYKDVCDAVADNAFFSGASNEILKNMTLYRYGAAPDTHIDVHKPSGSSDNGVTFYRPLASTNYFGGFSFNVLKDKTSATDRVRESHANINGTITITNRTNETETEGVTYVLTVTL